MRMKEICFVLFAINFLYAGLDSLPSVKKYNFYFIPLLQQNMHPIWYPNRISLTREKYFGNDYSDKILQALREKGKHKKIAAYGILVRLLMITKYTKPQRRPLVRDSAMYFVVRDALLSKNPVLKKKGIQIYANDLHPDLKLLKLKEVKKILGLTTENINTSAMHNIPLTKEEKIYVKAFPEKYRFNTQLMAQEKSAVKEIISLFETAKTFKAFKMHIPKLLKLDKRISGPLLFKKINNSIYYISSKEMGIKKHLRTLIIDGLGALYPDNKLLNSDYRLHIQYGESFRTMLQKKKISNSEVERYIKKVLKWGEREFHVKPLQKLELHPIIEEHNVGVYIIKNLRAKTLKSMKSQFKIVETKQKPVKLYPQNIPLKVNK